MRSASHLQFLRVRNIAFEFQAIEYVQSQAEPPEETLLRNELRQWIDQAIMSLPHNLRQVMTLRDVEGWTAEESVSLTLSNVNQRVLLHRARSRGPPDPGRFTSRRNIASIGGDFMNVLVLCDDRWHPAGSPVCRDSPPWVIVVLTLTGSRMPTILVGAEDGKVSTCRADQVEQRLRKGRNASDDASGRGGFSLTMWRKAMGCWRFILARRITVKRWFCVRCWVASS